MPRAPAEGSGCAGSGCAHRLTRSHTHTTHIRKYNPAIEKSWYVNAQSGTPPMASRGGEAARVGATLSRPEKLQGRSVAFSLFDVPRPPCSSSHPKAKPRESWKENRKPPIKSRAAVGTSRRSAALCRAIAGHYGRIQGGSGLHK